ncbi:MAG: S9 family peptidase [Pseudomonadota bacterium]
MKPLRLSLISLAAATLTSAALAVPPIATYIAFPEIESMKISPEGKFLAVTKRSDKSELMTVLRYPDLSISAHTYMGDFMEVEVFEWVNEKRLLIQPERLFPGYRAFKQPTGEIIGFDSDGKKTEMLFGYMAAAGQSGHIIQQRESMDAWARIIDIPPDDSQSVIIQTRSYGTKTDSSSLQRMNVRTGKLSRLSGSPVREANFITDSKHQPLFVTGETIQGDYETYWYKPADKTWQLVASSAQSAGSIWPFAESANANEFLALDDSDTPTARLIAWNPATKERRELFHSDASDLNIEGIDPNRTAWVYSYVNHYPEYWYPDPEHPLARAHRMMRATFKDANVTFTSETRDMSLAVAEVSSPTMPAEFFLLDVKNLKVLQRLASRPKLKREDLSTTDPFEVVVRDGKKIRGYLTTPRGSSGKDMPMIVLAHGGPHGPYDRYDFNEEVQLLASRGFAVLQVNFRGSGGRGNAFMLSGYGRWGREMQDDITDTVKWAIKSGLANRDRICIYGGSYGAYAALTGAFREPDMFKCAVGMSGIYDLPLMFTRGDIKELDRGVRYLREAVGTDEQEMRQRSPVYNADKIKAKVMLIHGREDERAPFEHAKRMRAALQKAGNEPVWISEMGEEHGIFNENHRAEVYGQMLAFFEANIGTAAPASK